MNRSEQFWNLACDFVERRKILHLGQRLEPETGLWARCVTSPDCYNEKTDMTLPLRALTICCISAVLTGCPNAFQESAQKTTNEAIYFSAQRDLDASDYSSAITKLLSLTAAYKTKREVVATIASAYAGRCGLQFLTLVQQISDNAGSRLFPLLMSNFRNATATNLADCVEGERWLRTLAPTNTFADLTTDENVMLAVLSLAKIGAALGTYADLDHDGSVDATFDACDTAKLPEATSREIGTGVTLAIAALSASGSSIGESAFSSVSNICGSLPGGFNFCTLYAPADFSTDQIKAINGLIGAQDAVGVGSCADTTTNCICP